MYFEKRKPRAIQIGILKVMLLMLMMCEIILKVTSKLMISGIPKPGMLLTGPPGWVTLAKKRYPKQSFSAEA